MTNAYLFDKIGAPPVLYARIQEHAACRCECTDKKPLDAAGWVQLVPLDGRLMPTGAQTVFVAAVPTSAEPNSMRAVLITMEAARNDLNVSIDAICVWEYLVQEII